MKHRAFLLAGVLVAFSAVTLGQNSEPAAGAGNGSSQAGPLGPSVSLQDRNPRYQLRPGDIFDVDFTLSPEFNQTVAVQPDGYGSLKAIGTIPVQGKTIPEVTETIKAAYAHVLHDPLVVIVLKDFDKPFFIASGQVARPGKYDLRSDLTLTEAIAMAGGMSEKAKTSQVVLYRKTSQGELAGKVFNLKKLLASRNLSEDPRLLPGDLLYVPQSTFSHFRPFLPTASMGAYYNPTRY